MPLMVKKAKSLSGQGLAEYTLVAFLVLGAIIPAVSLFGGDFTAALQAIFNGMNGTVVASANPLSQTQINQTSDPATTPTPSSGPTGQTASVQLKLQDGSTIDLNQYPMDIKAYVETTGTNGATLVLLAQMDSIIAQLSTNPNLPPEQVASLQALANQGHRIAMIEGLLESKILSASSLTDLSAMSFNFEGQIHTMDSLNWMIGWHGTGAAGSQDDPTSVINPLNGTNTGVETSQFIDLYHQAVATGALSDPAVNATITELASQIAYLTEVTDYSVWASMYDTMDLTTFRSLEVSNITHFDSSQICTTGGDTDTGVACQ